MGHSTERHDTALLRDARRRAGSASASRCGGSRWSKLGQPRSPTPARPTPARSGRRTSSGSSCPGASTPTARWASASYFESPYRPGEKVTRRRVLPLGLREPGARPAGEGRRRGADAAGVHAQVRRRRGGATTSTARTSGRSPRPSSTARWPTSTGVLRKPTDDESTPPLVGEAGAVGVRLDDGVHGRRLADARAASWSSTRRPWPTVRLARAGHPRLHPSPRRASARSTPTPARWCWCPTFRLPTLIHTRSGNAK